MKAVSSKVGVQVPQDASIDAEVDLGPTSLGFGVAIRMTIKLPGVDRAKAEELVQAAHKICPYSNATRNNIDVQLKVA
jgi:lipoyl-dependent peroxiredoxin